MTRSERHAITSYTARVTREGAWWMIHVPVLDALTQARRLSEVEEMARSLVAVTLDVPADQIHVDVEIESAGKIRVAHRLASLDADRRRAEQAQARFRTRQRTMAVDLAREGLTVRDIGSVLGVSFQRAQQLVADGGGAARGRRRTA